MNIEIHADEATLSNVNLGNEGSKEEPTSRTDLDFDGESGAGLLGTLLGVENVSPFWDEEGYALLLGVDKIVSKALMQHAKMEFGGLAIEDCTVKKFSCKPLNGRRTRFHCQVQVRHTPEQLTMIDALQLKTYKLALTTKTADLFE